MEFKEKLQSVRTQMKLSQEELADQLNISRQSVTKWENGQSFPDIRNLIQLSEIFKISIDQLVKENDSCNVNSFSRQQYPKQDIRMFLVRAKGSTYATDKHRITSSKPNSFDYLYSEDDYTYRDTYLGSEHFAGEEAVWLKDIPVYAMNYYGQSLNSNFSVPFLKEALSLVTAKMPFRGPEFYQKGEYSYYCQINGDFDFFHGEERIYCRQEKVYACMFHGGSLT